MSFCQDIRHLFRKKGTPSLGTGTGDPPEERKLSVATGHAAEYLEGLMKAPEGDRNLEDMAQCVEGATTSNSITLFPTRHGPTGM